MRAASPSLQEASRGPRPCSPRRARRRRASAPRRRSRWCAGARTARRRPTRSVFREAKARLLARLNEERRAAGAPPVAYDLLAARVGRRLLPRRGPDALVGTLGHRGPAALPPLGPRGRSGLSRGELRLAHAHGGGRGGGRGARAPPRRARADDGRGPSRRRPPPHGSRPELDARRASAPPLSAASSAWRRSSAGTSSNGSRCRRGRFRAGRARAVRREAARGMGARRRSRSAFEAPARPMSREEIAPPRVVRVSRARRRASSPARPPTPSTRTARAARSTSCGGVARADIPLLSGAGQLLRLRLRGAGLGRGAQALAPHGGADPGRG